MANFGTYWVLKRLSYCKIKKITSKTLAPQPQHQFEAIATEISST